jgi:hypothetical protein
VFVARRLRLVLCSCEELLRTLSDDASEVDDGLTTTPWELRIEENLLSFMAAAERLSMRCRLLNILVLNDWRHTFKTERELYGPPDLLLPLLLTELFVRNWKQVFYCPNCHRKAAPKEALGPACSCERKSVRFMSFQKLAPLLGRLANGSLPSLRFRRMCLN